MMKKILIVLFACLFAPVFASASPCNGKNVSIVNNTHVKYTVNMVDTGKSTIAPFAEAFVIHPNTTVLSEVQSGDGSWGNAVGAIHLSSPFYPGKTITLNYSYSKYLPFWCHADDPSAAFDTPFHINAYLDGSTTVFEINGAFSGGGDAPEGTA